MFPKGIIASIQPTWNSVIHNNELVTSFAIQCAPHVVALRINDWNTTGLIRRTLDQKGFKIPIVGIMKVRLNALNTHITPSENWAENLLDCGAEYVAMEVSDRIKTSPVVAAVDTGIPVIADIGEFKHYEIAIGCGVCAVTTALSGYLNEQTHPFKEPDIDLVRKCVKEGNVPVIAEGRYRTKEHIEMAREAGAHAVCMGNAIHEPKQTCLFSKIIFDGSWKELSKNGFRDLL